MLKPPEGHASWIEYAIATMDTRSAHLESWRCHSCRAAFQVIPRPAPWAMETIWVLFVKFMACTGVATWLLVGLITLTIGRHK